MPSQRLTRFAALLLALLSVSAWPLDAQEVPRDAECVEPLAFPVGAEVTIIGGVYIRALPDIDSGIVAYSPDRIAATIIGGPSCADGYNWWPVQRAYGEPQFNGWVAEGRPARQFILLNEPLEPELTCPTPLPAEIGQAVGIYRGLRVRAEATRQSRTLTISQSGESALILGGPVCAEGYNWWNVRVEDGQAIYEGWMVEGFPFLEEDRNDPLYLDIDPDAGPESIACGPAQPMNVGDIGVLRYSGGPLKALRASPTQSGELLYSLPSGVQLEILSGPFCNGGENWRQVRVAAGTVSAEGWMAEGTWMGRMFSGTVEVDGTTYPNDFDQSFP